VKTFFHDSILILQYHSLNALKSYFKERVLQSVIQRLNLSHFSGLINATSVQILNMLKNACQNSIH